MILITLFYQTVPVCPARIESAFEMTGRRLMPMLEKNMLAADAAHPVAPGEADSGHEDAGGQG